MNRLFSLLSVLLLLICTRADSQELKKKEKLTYIIDSTNHQYYYQRARALTSIDNRDSLYEAYEILTYLHYYDTVKYAKAVLRNDFLTIEKTNLAYYQRVLLGRWTSMWKGSNWSTTNYTDSMVVEFDGKTARFYKQGRLTRETAYSVTNEKAAWAELDFQLYFADDKSWFHIRTIISGADYITKLQYAKDHIGLKLDYGIHCSDCGYEIYMKGPPGWIEHY